MRWYRAGFAMALILGVGLIFNGSQSGVADEGTSNSVTTVMLPVESTPQQMLEDSLVPGGVIVHVGCGDGRTTADLVRNPQDRVQGLDQDAASIDQARQQALSLGLDGRLSYRIWCGERLPYADHLVNVLIWDAAAGLPDLDEVRRVMAPGGIAYLGSDKGWEKQVQPWPEDICQWTHFRADAGGTGANRDQRVGPPKHLQWEAGPRVMRSHEIESGLSGMITANGRLYYIIDEGPIGITDSRFPARWSLVCRDAFNGVTLWKRSLPNWGWQAWLAKGRENVPRQWLGVRTRPADVDRLMAAEGDVLYVTLGFGAPFSALDGRTGEVLRTYPETEGASELIVLDGVLLVRTDQPEPAVLALNADDGQLLWRHTARPIIARSLAAAANRAFLHTRDELVALDLSTGDLLWRQETQLRPAMVVATEQTVLVVQSQTVWALCTQDGEVRWKSPGVQSRGRAPDLFVVDDRVWYGRPHFHARDLGTGEVVQTMELDQVLESGHHRRCYADKATPNFMISGERGSEFLDLCDDDHSRHNWIRGPCIHGMLPANGLFYVPPHQCFCYPAVRMDGFFAVASRSAAVPSSQRPRREQGPAYGQPSVSRQVTSEDWPTYRQNAYRGGSVTADVPGELQTVWSHQLGGRLTQAVVAYGKAFVAQKDAGTVHCLDLKTGDRLWSRSAAGGIDSPPTLVDGWVIFGSRDGNVYCLRADDGQLAWRFHAAPEDRQIVSYDRLESAWPVHGSLLLLNGLVYGTAGRSGFLDGGISLFALEPSSGELIHETRLEGPWPDISQPSYPFHKDGYRTDVLTTDGQYLYMGRTALDRELVEVDAERLQLVGTQRGDQLEYRIMPGMRLVATGGFLDDTFWNRTWWMYSYVWPGFHYAQQAPKSGQMLVFDEENTYTVKHYATRNRHSPMLFPGSGYLVFADRNDNEPLFYRGEGQPEPIPWEVELPEDTRWTIYQDAAVDKGPGFTRSAPALWTSWMDVRVEAMALAGEHLLLAGPPDVVPEQDPLAALDGRMGGVLRVVRTTDGQTIADYPLSTRPAFDGLIAARGLVLLSTDDGSILCFGAVDSDHQEPQP